MRAKWEVLTILGKWKCRDVEYISDATDLHTSPNLNHGDLRSKMIVLGEKVLLSYISVLRSFIGSLYFIQKSLLLVILILHNILLGFFLHIPGRWHNHQIEPRWININSKAVFGDINFPSQLTAKQLETVNDPNVWEDEDVGQWRMYWKPWKLTLNLILGNDEMI